MRRGGEARSSTERSSSFCETPWPVPLRPPVAFAAPMANRTDPLAKAVHGTNPQNLIEAIVRNRIYSNIFWKEHCFGLTAETLVDKAMLLTDFGGQYGGNRKPTKFLCLVQKMLQLQPEKEIVIEFIKNEEYKYVRLLGAFYLRMVGTPKDIYQYLEPLYNDYRRIRRKTDFGACAALYACLFPLTVRTGYDVTHVDEFIDELLTKEHACDIALPFLPKRSVVEESDDLPPRISVLEADLLEEEEAEKRRIEEEAAKIEKEKEKAKWKMSRKEKQEAESARDRRDERDDFGASEDRRSERKSWRDDLGGYKRDENNRERRPDDRDRRDRDRDRDYDDRRERDRADRGGGSGGGDRRDRDRRDDRDRDRDRDHSRDRERDRRPEEKGKKDGELSIEETNALRAQLGMKPLAAPAKK